MKQIDWDPDPNISVARLHAMASRAFFRLVEAQSLNDGQMKLLRLGPALFAWRGRAGGSVALTLQARCRALGSQSQSDRAQH
jgi:hypothetical protein